MSADGNGVQRQWSRGVVLACITTATFTDLVAYSVAVPVLPDFATRFNAGATALLSVVFGISSWAERGAIAPGGVGSRDGW